jgi:uncharacterized membrane protein
MKQETEQWLNARLPEWRMFLALVLASGFAVSLLAIRMFMTGRITYGFLLWNLFLAWIPLVCAWLVMHARRFSWAWKLVWIPVILWLLFFPNSPYILTDLGHLARITEWPNVPLGYDVVMILAFALDGLFLGFISLFILEQVWREHFGGRIATILSLASLLLAGFGIYFGRFLRWNSWDIFHQPLTVLQDIMRRLVDPLNHPRSWGFTLLYAGLLITIYLVVRLMRKQKA